MRNRSEALSQRLEAMIQKLPPERQRQLRELFESLLERSSQQRTRAEALEKLEEKYLLALQEDKNILGFHREKTPNVTPPPERKWNLRIPSLIESPNYGEIFRMAFELHLRSSRGIFVSWRDIGTLERQNPISLLDLSTATIFIPDVTHLQLAEQRSALSVIRNPCEDKPYFMAGTTLPYTDLVRLGSLDTEFLEGISQAYLKLTKSVSQYKRDGLIRYFLESLS